MALQLALGQRAWAFLASQIDARPALLATPTAKEQKLLDNLALLVGRKRDEAELAACLELLTDRAAAADSAGVLAVLAGLSQGLSETGTSLRKSASSWRPTRRRPMRRPPRQNPKTPNRPRPWPRRSPACPNCSKRAQHVALDPAAAIDQRLRAIAALAHCGTAADPAELAALLAVDQPPAVSSVPADCLTRLAKAPLAAELFAQWNSYATATRRSLASAALRSPVTTEALLAALEAGTITALELDPALRDLLTRLPNETLRERATKLLASAVPADRQRVLDEFAGAWPWPPTASVAAGWWPSTAWPAIRSSGAGGASVPTCRGSARSRKSNCWFRCWIPAGRSRPTTWLTRW